MLGLAGPANARPDSGFGPACYQAAAFGWPLRQSLEICREALRDPTLSPRDRGATLVNRGIVELHAKRYAAAVADFDAALVVAPDLPAALVNKGTALLEAGRPADAVDVLTAALATSPDLPVAYYTRAMANEAVGATAAAYDDYRRAAALAPDWAEPVEQLRRFSVARRPTARG